MYDKKLKEYKEKQHLKFPTSEPCFEWQKAFIQAEKPVRCYSSMWQNSRLALRGQDDVRTFFDDTEEEVKIPAYSIPA